MSLKNNSSEYVLDKNVTYYFLANAEISKDLNFIFKNNKSKLYIQGKFENMNFNFIGDFSKDNLTSDDISYEVNGTAEKFSSSVINPDFDISSGTLDFFANKKGLEIVL